jgi:hypothetical protein
MNLPMINPRTRIVSTTENRFALSYYTLIKDRDLNYDELFLCWTRCMQQLLRVESTPSVLATSFEEEVYALLDTFFVTHSLTIGEKLLIISNLLQRDTSSLVQLERENTNPEESED